MAYMIDKGVRKEIIVCRQLRQGQNRPFAACRLGWRHDGRLVAQRRDHSFYSQAPGFCHNSGLRGKRAV